MKYWSAALEEHKNHESFRVHDWPFSLEKGFTCECSGQEVEWRISISDIRSFLPEAEETYLSILQRLRLANKFSKKKKQEKQRADTKAKALLHRYLTKKQRWELRATKSITVMGQDKNVYRITEGSCNNVIMLDKGGSEKFRLCVICEKEVPIYDLMLAQKLTIENDLTSFLSVANVMDLKTKSCFSGSVLLEKLEMEELEINKISTMRENIPDEVLEEPEAWVTERLLNARF